MVQLNGWAMFWVCLFLTIIVLTLAGLISSIVQTVLTFKALKKQDELEGEALKKLFDNLTNKNLLNNDNEEGENNEEE